MARAIAGFSSADDHKRLSLASHLAGLIVRVWGIARDTSDGTEQAREAYREWLELELVNRRVAAEPLLASAIADFFKEMTRNALDNPPEDVPAQMFQALLHSQLEWVPAVVGNMLKQDQAFMDHLGITFHSVVSFANIFFDPDVVWPALEMTINGEPATAHPINSRDVVHFELTVGSSDTIITITYPSIHRQYRLNDAALRLLSRTPSLREEVLRQNRHWFDCSEETFEEILPEIVFYSEPRQRVQIVEGWRSKNMARYYALLEQSLHAEQTFRLEDFRPADAEGMLSHFRLIELGEAQLMADMLNSTAPMLLQEVGLEEALDRLTRMPIPLSVAVIEAVAALSVEEQRNLIRKFLHLSNSPLSACHLLRLLTFPGSQIPAFQRLARRVVARLIDALNDGTITAYFALLVWVHELFGSWNAMEAWSYETRMAMVWAHTDKLFRILVSAGSNPEWMIQTFGAGQGRFINELLHHDQQVWHDVAHPRRQHPLRFLIAGLCYGLAQSSGAIIDHRIQERLIECVFPTIDDTPIPAMALFADSSREPNVIYTFLGYAPAEQIEQLLGTEAAEVFSSSAIRMFTESNLDLLLSSPDNVTAWTLLNVILTGQQPAEDIRDRILELFRHLDLVKIYRANPETGTIALRTVARQVFVLEDTDTGKRLADQMVQVARILAESQARGTLPFVDGESEPAHNYVNQLLEACIYLVIATYPDQERTPAYSAMLRQIVDANPLAATLCRPFIERLCCDLPIVEAQLFWSLLMRLRAE